MRFCKYLSAGAFVLAGVSASAAQNYSAEFSNQWGLRMIGVDKALALGLDGRGVLVGITDTGLLTGPDAHPEFAGRLNGLSYDGYWGISLDADDNSHGTHVAGIIAANRDGIGMMGVASGSTIVPLRTLGGGGLISGDEVLSGPVRYALANGVRIFNASWGIPGRYDQFYDPDTGIWDVPFDRAAALAGGQSQISLFGEVVDAGGVMVFANGNINASVPLSFQAALPYYAPQLERGWLAVTSVGPTGVQASYAQSCSVGMMWCLAAPGGDINMPGLPDGVGDGGIISTAQPLLAQNGVSSYTPDGQYVSYDGTSMAAPHVTGALAIAKQLYPKASFQQLRLLVLQTATDIGAQGIDGVYGWGLLNVGNLVSTASPTAGAVYAQQPWSRQGVVNHIIDTLNPNASPDRNGDWGYWVQPLGMAGTINSSDPLLAANLSAAGLSAGVEGSVAPDWYLKAFGAVSQSTVNSGGNSAVDTGFHIGGQVVYETPAWFADATLGASVFSGSVERRASPGMAGTVIGTSGAIVGSASTTDMAHWGAFRFGYHVDAGSVGTISPYLFGRLANQNLSAFAETGAITGISGGQANVFSGELGLGVKWMGPALAAGPLEVTPVLDVAYSRQASDYRRSFDLLGNTMVAGTAPIGSDTLQVGTALEMNAAESPFKFKAGYSIQLQSGAVVHAASVKLMGAF